MSGGRLEVDGLCVEAMGRRLVDDVSFALGRGELVALVGASGAGKSLIGRSLVGLIPFQPGVVAGEVRFVSNQESVVVPARGAGRAAALRQLRGRCVSWIPQDARAALAPVYTIGRQLRDTLRHHRKPHDAAAIDKALSQAGFPHPDQIVGQYAHTLSGGMARRAQVALGLATGAPFLVADEPTTGLDKPVQVRLVQTLRALVDAGQGVLWITHELGLVRRFADRAIHVDAGRLDRSSAAAGGQA